MLQIIWDTRGYFFWLLVVSLFCFLLERLWPWRRRQKALRPQLAQDLFWLVFNGHYAGVLLAYLTSWLVHRVDHAFGLFGLPSPESIRFLGDQPLWLQAVIFLVAKDFLEWCVHNLLHRVPWLWEIHKLHHSIEVMDWIGNFRFHWLEIAVYNAVKYLPLVILGVDDRVILILAVVSTLIGHLNHANLEISWGPLRYLINSPRMHVWHHDVVCHLSKGQNFGIVLSVWDWIFGTAYMPDGQPAKLGFEGMEETFPKSLVGRFLYPLFRPRRRHVEAP